MTQYTPSDAATAYLRAEQASSEIATPSSGFVATESRESSNSTREQDFSRQPTTTPQKSRRRRRTKAGEPEDPNDEPKRRVVSSACVACRKRKSKCDGNTPSCAACQQVYNTQCIYDPNSDHRRKGVYRQDGETSQPRESTLNTIVQAILNYPEDEVPALVRQIRTCESLDAVAKAINARQDGSVSKQELEYDSGEDSSVDLAAAQPSFESQLGMKMGELRMDDGSVKYIGGTSHLLFLNSVGAHSETYSPEHYQQPDRLQLHGDITTWTSVTNDPALIAHLVNLYFTWHYSYFTCLSRSLFVGAFLAGRHSGLSGQAPEYCSPLLVNAMLALGCHFTSRPAARDDPNDPATAGDHFFREAKRLLLDNDEHEKPHIATVQALALMSVREAGCGRESRGWVYSGMSFRMACDMGLHLDSGTLSAAGDEPLDHAYEDARRMTFWGCFLFDKCWSNYMGRLPQLPRGAITCPKFDVFPDEDAKDWIPYGDSGPETSRRQPARTRAVALQTSALCEISSDLMGSFYNPGAHSESTRSKEKQSELKKLSDLQIRLENWRKNLPKEMEPRDGALSSVFIMHMFFQLLHIHLFRPFLKYTASTSPLPPTVSPRKHCTAAATAISRLVRLYKRTYGLRQICNICVYMIHTACTIHLLNLPDKDARRDIVHGARHLEEIAESWPCAARTLDILETLAQQWHVDIPPEAAAVLARRKVRIVSPSLSPPQLEAEPRPVPVEQPQHWAAYDPSPLPMNNVQRVPGIHFGGVDQLLQDVGGARPVRTEPAADWTLVDQRELAWGLGNWEFDASGVEGFGDGGGGEHGAWE